MSADDISNQLDSMNVTLERVLTQTTATNGRVAHLEHAVFGDPPHKVDGLMEQVAELREFVLDGKAVLTFVKWALVILVPSSVAIAIAALT